MVNVTQFLETFFQGKSPKELIAIRAIAGTELGGSWYFKTLGESIAKIRKVKKDNSLYFGVCTRTAPGARKADVGNAYAIWVDLDLDLKSTPQKRKIIEETRFLFPFSAVIDSGNGLHFYWFLDTPSSDHNLIEKTAHNLGVFMGGDSVHDVTRIMRLPATYNLKKGPPGLLVQVLDWAPQNRYALNDLYTASCLEPKIIDRILTGSARGYKSRSHRDWATITALIKCDASDELIHELYESHPIGDKADESDAYLEHTIKKARRRTDADSGTNRQALVTQENNAWIISRNDKQRQISTYVYYPLNLIRGTEGDPDTFVGTVHTQYNTQYEGVRLSHRDFISSTALAERLPYMDCVFLGTDSDVRFLLPYLYEQFKDSGGASKQLIKQTGFYRGHWIGSSQILGAGGIISEDDSLIVYDQRHDEGTTTQYNYQFDFGTLEDLNEETTVPPLFLSFFKLLFQINKQTDTMTTSVGWLCASFFKSRLETVGYRFPFLNVSGSRGAGKTTLIKEVLQPLAGYETSRTYDCSTTKFVLLSLLGASTDIFVSLSEFRQSALSDTNIRNLLRYLLLSYDGGIDPRGRANQTIKNYILSAPITLDGEDAVSDPALLERSVHIRMSPDAISTNQTEQAFADLTELDLNAIGSYMIAYSLEYDFESQMKWCMEFVTHHLESLDVRIAARPIKNVAVVLFGLRFLESFAAFVGAPLPDFGTYEDAIHDCLSKVVNTRSGRTRRQADDFLEAIAAEAARMLTDFSQSTFQFKYDPIDNVLWFHMATAYSWFRKHRRQQGLPALEKDSVELQLKESIRSDASYVLTPQRVSSEGVPLMCYGILLKEASEVLDTPTKLVPLGVNVKMA